MSSMRNAVQRRNHKERAQPLEREKWGVLEKHKDYSLRAKDYNEKKARLKILRQKAAERNPDEFHYGMLSSKSKKGRKLADRGNSSLSQDAVKLLKTQDSAYLQTMIQRTRRSIQKLEQGFVLEVREGGNVVGERVPAGNREHLLFTNSLQEPKQQDVSSILENESSQQNASRFVDNGQYAEVETKSHGRNPKMRLRTVQNKATEEKRALRKKQVRERNLSETKVASLKAREKQLRDAENELENQRAKMSNSIGGVTKNGIKWKVRERKS